MIRLRSVFTDRENGQVSVSGQVRYPGAFNITRGERLSSLLERAGGLTDQAYPYGAVFTRERAAVAEREGNIRQARSIDAQLSTLATSPQASAANRDTLTFLTSLGQQVRNEPVLGRITMTADLAVLRSRPELDIVLEPGDTLYIPVRPATVTVTGEVLNSGSFQFENGLQLADYLSRRAASRRAPIADARSSSCRMEPRSPFRAAGSRTAMSASFRRARRLSFRAISARSIWDCSCATPRRSHRSLP